MDFKVLFDQHFLWLLPLPFLPREATRLPPCTEAEVDLGGAVMLRTQGRSPAWGPSWPRVSFRKIGPSRYSHISFLKEDMHRGWRFKLHKICLCPCTEDVFLAQLSNKIQSTRKVDKISHHRSPEAGLKSNRSWVYLSSSPLWLFSFFPARSSDPEQQNGCPKFTTRTEIINCIPDDRVLSCALPRTGGPQSPEHMGLIEFTNKKLQSAGNHGWDWIQPVAIPRRQGFPCSYSPRVFLHHLK